VGKSVGIPVTICRDCDLWKPKTEPKQTSDGPCDILHVTPRDNWQAVTERGRFALQAHGQRLTVAEIVKPTIVELRGALATRSPRVVFCHAFCVSAGNLIALAKQWPSVRFVSVSHSQENHVFTWPQYFAEMRDVLAASQTIDNLYFAGSDESQHWQQLGYRHVLRWHWPCVLRDYQDPPAIDPPVVLITSRADLVKALPSQVLAAALLQRQRGVRVAISATSESQQRKAGIDALIEAAGLQAERWPWLSHGDFLARLRRDVSLVLQPSMSETFNYVSWEAGSVGRPWVGSDAIRHTPSDWRADPNDPADIARVAGEILDGYQDASGWARRIAETVAARNNSSYAAGIAALL
jgi:glycosyltransferase involved in cell wall biosynthesis